jgi:predicted nucleotidyltransferase
MGMKKKAPPSYEAPSPLAPSQEERRRKVPESDSGRENATGSTPAAVSGIADALFTKVQQRVLAVLFGNPRRSFYANEVIGLAASGTGAVQRELARLEAAGLVTVTRVGKQKHFQANSTAPVFEELRGLVLKSSGLVDVLREVLAPLAAHIEAAFVFGSVAKGQDTAKSDIDLLVVSESLSYADLFSVLEEATQRLGRTVNPTVYSRRELNKRIRADNAFVKRVLAQPKIFVLGNDLGLAA